MTHSSKLWGQRAECERARAPRPPHAAPAGPPPRTQSPPCPSPCPSPWPGPGLSSGRVCGGAKGPDRQTQPCRPPSPSGCRTKVSALEREPSSPCWQRQQPRAVTVANVHGVNAPSCRSPAARARGWPWGGQRARPQTAPRDPAVLCTIEPCGLNTRNSGQEHRHRERRGQDQDGARFQRLLSLFFCYF